MQLFRNRKILLIQLNSLGVLMYVYACKRVDQRWICAVTQNQIAYQSLLEAKRHNVANENLTSMEIDTKKRQAGAAERQAAVAAGRLKFQNAKDLGSTLESGSRVLSNIINTARTITGHDQASSIMKAIGGLA